jgi:hypothetical protein
LDPNLGPPDEAALNALNAAKARADGARRQALYLEGDSHFPGDWDAAESQYRSAGEQAEKSTLGDVRESANRYNAAAAAYDEITGKALPLYVRAREEEITRARAEAIGAGIAEVSPESLALADDTVQNALARYEGGDYYAAAESAFLALDMYRALKDGAAAYMVRREIGAHDFVKYDAGNYNLAEEALTKAVGDYNAGNIAQARESAAEALLRYQLALDTAWGAFAAERRDAATRERRAALDMKANVAVRNEFNAANDIYTQGETSFRAKRYSAAADFYIQAEPLFVQVTAIAADKRRAAEEAIRTAEEKMVESDENAQNAERILEGDV